MTISSDKRKLGRRKRLIVLTPLLLVLLALGVYWRPHKSSSPPPELYEQPEPKPQPPPISKGERIIEKPKIVLLAPLSGLFGRDGESLRQGTELAWKELEGKRVAGSSLIVKDGGKEPSKTIQLAKDLSSDPDVLIVIAHLPVSFLSHIIPLYEEEQLPLVVPANSHESLVGKPWVFPFIISDRMEGAFEATAARKWAKDKAIAVVYEPDSYGKVLFEGFEKEAMEQKLSFEAIAYEPEDSSANELISKISQKDFPVVCLAGSPLWGTDVVRVLREKGFKGRLLVPRSYGETFLEDLFGDFLSQLHFIWPVSVMDTENRAMQDFRRKFKEKFWQEPNWLAVMGYDAMMWLGGTLCEAPLSRGKIAKRLLAYNCLENAYQGAGGAVFFDEKGCLQRLPQITVYEKGQFVPPQDSKP